MTFSFPFDTPPPSDRMLIDALCILLATQNQVHMPAPGSAEAQIIQRAREIVYHYGTQAIARIAASQGETVYTAEPTE